VQNCLGSPGLAPTASIATELADRNLREYLSRREHQKADPAQPPTPVAPPAPVAAVASAVE
jgi:hypothetical protein